MQRCQNSPACLLNTYVLHVWYITFQLKFKKLTMNQFMTPFYGGVKWLMNPSEEIYIDLCHSIEMPLCWWNNSV